MCLKFPQHNDAQFDKLIGKKIPKMAFIVWRMVQILITNAVLQGQQKTHTAYFTNKFRVLVDHISRLKKKKKSYFAVHSV